MHRTLLITAAVALALALAPATPVDAAADQRVARQAWMQTGPVPTFVGAADRLYVSASAEMEGARAFITFDGHSLDAVRWAGITLVLHEAAGESVLPDNAVIAACAITRSLDRDGQIDAAGAPSEDCTIRVDISRDPHGEWKVPLDPFESAWRSRAVAGVVLLPQADVAPGTFRVSFDATATAVAVPPTSGIGSTDPSSPSLGVVVPASGGAVPAFGAPGALSPPPPELTPPVPESPRRSPRAAGPIVSTSRGRSATQPPFAPLALGLVVCVAAVFVAPTRVRRRLVVPARIRDPRSQGAVGAGLLVALAILPMAASEVTTFKAGLVLIFLVAVLGLHILVNWAGQLSLAHAGMVGFPAFVVLGLSDVHGISPIYLVPVAVAVGAAVGAVVALPTLRAQGLQVALVTLAAGVAIDRYFFTKSWLVGPSGGRTAARPAIGPWHFETSRGLYPILLVFVVLAASAAWLLMHSKVFRAWSWVRSDPTAAAAFGIPVVAHRILAFAVGGAFAGLAGGLSVMWVERLTPLSFPTGLSFSYLLVTVISGPGYLGGLALAAALLEGGRLFSSGAGTLVSYAGPVALILVITRYSAGINGAGRSVMERMRASRAFTNLVDRSEEEPEPITVGLVLGVVAILAGFLAIAVAWYHAGNTDQVWIQNQEIMSGGFGGLSLVLTGSALLIRDRMGRAQAVLVRNLQAIGRAPGDDLESLLPEIVASGESEAIASAARKVRVPSTARARS